MEQDSDCVEVRATPDRCLRLVSRHGPEQQPLRGLKPNLLPTATIAGEMLTTLRRTRLPESGDPEPRADADHGPGVIRVWPTRFSQGKIVPPRHEDIDGRMSSPRSCRSRRVAGHLPVSRPSITPRIK